MNKVIILALLLTISLFGCSEQKKSHIETGEVKTEVSEELPIKFDEFAESYGMFAKEYGLGITTLEHNVAINDLVIVEKDEVIKEIYQLPQGTITEATVLLKSLSENVNETDRDKITFMLEDLTRVASEGGMFLRDLELDEMVVSFIASGESNIAMKIFPK
ncbi:hypothetical protein [Metabacillus fastidiosus]|uniref:hypothetical protein n=1 Tax=Metabacillus fastidiosus TaxID=1458 RepID=UPI003D2E7CF0